MALYYFCKYERREKISFKINEQAQQRFDAEYTV